MINTAPFMQFHVDDYYADTRGLSCLEHGAYLQLIFQCWKLGGSVPECKIARMVGLSAEQWGDMRDELAEFFWISGGEWRHAEVTRQLAPIFYRGERVRGAKWDELREQVFFRDRFRCRYCGTPTDSPHCDHIRPIAAGGSNELDNLATACHSCNSRKGTSQDPAWRAALEVSR